ncbi:hypothetical protein JVT61DRAFT_12215 [Boletus reticuloceps]|uniref:Uncharacterized protein n=1 Tax=Boletus reticuloceps TaxID=495285 RepID=A0A8I2YE81_9AGAM|nr:hypothetical protein JVT61DRAFT_12215 [Boletus reticuloceps]
MVDCARHEMKLPCSVGDLQKGEKYVNIDYLVFSTITQFALIMFNFSYNIACQWHKKIWVRMSGMPECLRLDHDMKIVRFFVPKFHIRAHIQKCQTAFSFNFTHGVGRTDGEAPERGWANFNHVASSTKEMGPGARHDHLDNHFGDSNWKKRMLLRCTMLRKMVEAVLRAEAHRQELKEFEKTIVPEQLERWHTEYEEWEEKKSKSNPFNSQITPITLSAVRLQLAEEESWDLASRTDVSLHPEVSPLILISSGLDLQDLQRHLASDVAGMGIHASDLQKGNIAARCNALQQRIDSWMQIQLLYMPSVATLRATGCSDNEEDVANRLEKIKLNFPSELSPGTPCDQRLQRVEWDLRYAQANDALNEV